MWRLASQASSTVTASGTEHRPQNPHVGSEDGGRGWGEPAAGAQEDGAAFRYEGECDAFGARHGRGILWREPAAGGGGRRHYYDGLWSAGREGDFAMVMDPQVRYSWLL